MGDPSNTRRSRDSAPPSQAMPPHNHMHSHVHRHDQGRGISKMQHGTSFPRHVHEALARYEKDVPKATYTAAGLWRMKTAAFKAAEAAKAQAGARPKPPVPVFPEETTPATQFCAGERVTLRNMDLRQYNGQAGIVQRNEGSKIVLKLDSGKFARVCSSKAFPESMDLDDFITNCDPQLLDVFAGVDADTDLDPISDKQPTATPSKPASSTSSTKAAALHSPLAHLGTHFQQAVQRPGKACQLSMHVPKTDRDCGEAVTAAQGTTDNIDMLLHDWFDNEFLSEMSLQISA